MTEKEEEDDDREQDVRVPQPDAMQPGIPIPIVGERNLGDHKYGHRGSKIRQKLYHGPGTRKTPYAVPDPGLPLSEPEEVQEAIGEPIEVPAPPQEVPAEVGGEPERLPNAAQAPLPVGTGAGATSGLEGGITPWESFQNTNAETFRSQISAGAQSAESQGNIVNQLMLGGAGIAAAASINGQGGQFGPPSAPAEMQSSTLIAELLLAKRLGELKRRSSGNTSPVPVGPTGGAEEEPGEWDIPERPRVGAGATGGGEGGELVTAIVLATAAADAIGRGADAIQNRRNKSRDRLGAPQERATGRGRGGFTGRSAADMLTQPRVSLPKKTIKEPDFVKRNYGRDDDSDTFDESQE